MHSLKNLIPLIQYRKNNKGQIEYKKQFRKFRQKGLKLKNQLKVKKVPELESLQQRKNSIKLKLMLNKIISNKRNKSINMLQVKKVE